MSAEVERAREKKKLIEALSSDIATADNLALRSRTTPEVTQEERRRLVKLTKELKQMQEVY